MKSDQKQTVPKSRKGLVPVTTWLLKPRAKVIKKIAKQEARSFAGQCKRVLEGYAEDMEVSA